jgi:hypothetical protein
MASKIAWDTQGGHEDRRGRAGGALLHVCPRGAASVGSAWRAPGAQRDGGPSALPGALPPPYPGSGCGEQLRLRCYCAYDAPAMMEMQLMRLHHRQLPSLR